MGCEVLADVLEAAAGALRKARADVQDAMEAGAAAASAAGDSAVNVGTEMATGTVALVQTATEALAGHRDGHCAKPDPSFAGTEPAAAPRRGGRGRKKRPTPEAGACSEWPEKAAHSQNPWIR